MFHLLFCLFIYLLIFVSFIILSVYILIGLCVETHALMNARAGEGVGGGCILTRASGCNFPLFLVYPVDMPGNSISDSNTKYIIIDNNNSNCINNSNTNYSISLLL